MDEACSGLCMDVAHRIRQGVRAWALEINLEVKEQTRVRKISRSQNGEPLGWPNVGTSVAKK